MCKKLPLNGCKWANVKDFDSDFIKNYDDNSDKGYLLEVDVEYPKELHSTHRDMPFLPEKRHKLHKEFKHKVTNEIEKAHRKVYKTFNITHEPENKLIATIQDKNEFAVNISSLKLALKHGLRLKKVYRI